MINADTYPELDEARIDALFAAGQQAVADAFAAVAESAADASARAAAIYRFLPRKYLPRYTPEFARRFAVTVSTVAWKLAEPNHVYGLACTAEDLALKYILDLARAAVSAGGDDEPFDEFADAVFDDQSFLVLWDPAQDGSEDATLAFADWFQPFGEREQVHPFLQRDSNEFRLLWSEVEIAQDDLEDPATEVFIALREDWLEVPDQIADQIPTILAETRAALFPDQAARRLTTADRERLYESAAEDVRLLLDVARKETETAYDVWLVKEIAPRRKTRQRLHAGLPLEEALDLRKLERMGEYRGVTDVELRVYPEDHVFVSTDEAST